MEEHRLWVSENRELRRIFGLKRNEMMGLKNMHNEEHNKLYSQQI
jgi:hypothetical protein